MYEYLLTGTGPSGRQTTRLVEAPTADDAVWQMEQGGFEGVILHTDDLIAPFFKSGRLLKHFRPAELVRLRGTGPLEFAWVLSKALYRQLWIPLLLSLAAIVIRRLIDAPWDGWDLVPLLLASMPAAFGVYWAITSFRRPERRLLKAIGWARWHDADAILRRRKLAISPFERILRRAQCLAGLGRLSEALAEYDRIRDFPGVTEHRYWAFQAIVFAAAKEPNRVFEVLVRAHEEDPDGTAVRVDYAAKLVQVRRDVRKAKEMLAGIGTHAVADFAATVRLATDGLIDLTEGRAGEAVVQLGEAARRIERFTRGNPSLLPSLARVGAWHCQAQAANGDTTAARKQLQAIRPILSANQEFDLLRECEQAVG